MDNNEIKILKTAILNEIEGEKFYKRGKGYARELIDVESSAEVRGWRAKGSRLSKIKRVRKALALSSKEKVGGKSPEEYLNDHEGVRQFGLL